MAGREKPKVAVIGAGIAGIACAAKLEHHGCDVTVFEKSRGVGGRMATRRVDPWQWDHGVQYITGDDPAFRALLTALPTWSHAGTESWFVGEPSQSQLVKTLADGMNVHLQTQLSGIARHDAGWSLATQSGNVGEPYAAVALAMPAPQTRALLPPVWQPEALDAVRIDPCWALMVATPTSLELPTAATSPHEHIAWCAADHTKPGRRSGHGQYVLHATAEWSARHLEWSAEQARAALLDCFREIAGPVEILYATAHRWRYALTQAPLGQPFLLDHALRIGACGDWCLGARVEHGFVSGTALGDAMAQTLEHA